MERINFAKLQAILYPNTASARVKSVTSPPAQATSLLHSGKQPDHPLTAIASDLFRKEEEPKHLLAVIELLLLYGLRISEVLSIVPSDVLSSGHIRIKGLKGSNSRLVIPLRYGDFWSNSGRHLLPLSTIYSRFYFYRNFKRLGLYQHYAGGTNNAVTHVFRNELLRGLSANEVSLDNMRNFIGHKNENNTLRYANKRKL